MLETYWKYAGTRYKHKFKAIEASHGDIHNITWDFANSSLKDYDWTKEPAESFEQLMKMRAIQLRETYPYLKFWFSGGSDSTTVLRVFLENNIHLDEICVYRYYHPEDESNQEVTNFTIPYLKSIQTQIPKTKIKLYCWDPDLYHKYLSDHWLETRSAFTARHYYLPNIRGDNYCNIICQCEPIINKVEDKWFLEFLDSDFGELSSCRNVECFFTTGDLPQLHAKQSYILKNYLENNYDSIPVPWIYKEIVRKVIRDKAIAPEPIYFRKNTITQGPAKWIHPKDRMMLKSMTPLERDKYRSIISSTVEGKSLLNLYRSYAAFTAELGD